VILSDILCLHRVNLPITNNVRILIRYDMIIGFITCRYRGADGLPRWSPSQVASTSHYLLRMQCECAGVCVTALIVWYYYSGLSW